ncbi:MAG: DNA-binding protein, partial [Propionibacterium sp. 4572_24]
IRNMQVMIDRDLAQLYEVETRVLNQAVKRNIERFPPEFMFQLTEKELDNWKSQIVISNKETMGIRKMPFAFTEQGVSMLSGILKSNVAIKISIKIINSFVEMRKFLTTNAAIFQRIDQLEYKHIGTNQRIDQILNALETNELKPKQGIFYEGQIFDAYNFVSDLFRSAESSIIIIDNYIDDSVLIHLTQKKESVKVTIYTKHISQLIKLSLKKFNQQYKDIKIKEFSKSHDRFIIIDDKEIYHFGASLKDLGKKWFGFSKFHKDALNILEKL